MLKFDWLCQHSGRRKKNLAHVTRRIFPSLPPPPSLTRMRTRKNTAGLRDYTWTWTKNREMKEKVGVALRNNFVHTGRAPKGLIGRAGASPPSRTTGPRCLYICMYICIYVFIRCPCTVYQIPLISKCLYVNLF